MMKLLPQTFGKAMISCYRLPSAPGVPTFTVGSLILAKATPRQRMILPSISTVLRPLASACKLPAPYFYLTETHPGTELLFTNNESHRNFLAQACTLAHRDMSRDRALQLLSRTKPDCKLWQILRAYCLLLARNYYRRNNYRQTAGYPKRESTTPPKPARRL